MGISLGTSGASGSDSSWPGGAAISGQHCAKVGQSAMLPGERGSPGQGGLASVSKAGPTP